MKIIDAPGVATGSLPYLNEHSNFKYTNMKTLQLSEQKARSIYKTAPPELKIILEENFGKDFFSEDVTERINGWDDMMSEADRPDVPEFSDVPEDLRPFFKGVYKNVVMAEAYNGCKGMDIYDSSKYRHYPWFRTNGSPSSFAFYASYFDNAFAIAGSGSRLSFKEEKHVLHAAKNHTAIFREMLES